MAKKLIIFSVILFFLFGLMAFARVDDAVTKPGKKTRESAQLERQRYVHPRISDIALPGSQNVPIEEFDEATFVDPEGDVIPVSVERARKPALKKKHGYLYQGSSEIVPLEKTKDALPHGWLFNYDDEISEFYLSGGTAGDEWGIWFQSPQAACSLYAVEFQFYGGVPGGTINLNVMEAGSVWPDTIHNSDSIAVEDVFGDNLMGVDEEFPLEIVATSDWERFIFPDWDYDINVGRDIFWIHWTKTGDHPMILGDDGVPSDYLHTWDFEPNQDGDEKWSHYGADPNLIEAMVRCEVVFYEDPPPNVWAKQMNDTYRTDAITLTASANDNALDPALEGIASGNLIYSLNGDLDTLVATVTGDTAVGFTLSATIPAGASGDVVEYYFEAWDLADLHGRSFPALSFMRTEPVNPYADIMVVADRSTAAQDDLDLYCTVLDENNLVYEFWDVSEHNGIDASVVGFGPTNIVVYGWGTTSVPCTTEADPGYGAFLDAGGNLLLIDQDWFYGHNLPESPVFEAGDFAYDYFGIVGGANDPNDGGSPAVSIADTVFYGQDVTAMDSPFTQALGGITINHNIYGTTNWGDYFDASNATVIFKGAVDGNTYGSVKEGTKGYKAVYLGFMIDAAIDTTAEGVITYDAFADFFNGVIEYFGAVSPPVVDIIGEGTTRYGVASGTVSGVVNADVIDGDGTITGVVAKWTVDGGAEESTPMTLVEGSHYAATITPTGFTDTSTVVLWVEATDNDGLTTASATGSAWGTDFTPTAGVKVLYMYDYYAPYYTYGPADADSIMKANMTAAGFFYDYWDVWDNYQADYASVLSNYDAVIYAGVYDWDMNPEESAEHSLTEFVDGGGFLLYSSEEVLGTYGDWGDDYDTFWPGHFVYDVLGVEWVGNDYNYVGVATDDDGGTGLIADLDTATIILADTVDYFGSMADLCDPVGYGTEDMLPSPFLADYTGAGNFYYASSINGNVLFMAFNISMLPVDQQEILFGNFATWAGIPVGIEDDYVSLPKAFALHQNYPNPFNPTTNIEFAVPEVADVKIIVYNLLGQKIIDLANKAYQPGHYQVIWNGKDVSGCDVSSGVYFYRMTAGNFTKTSKMIYLK